MKIKPEKSKNSTSLFRRSFVFFACFILASITAIYAQTNTITGTVTDNNAEPLIGVTVRVQGTSTGTITDIDGNYSIAAKPNETLEFSFVGMKPQLIAVDSKTKIDVALEEDATMLTETVVIGYGTAKKADLTGSIGNVNAETIMKQPGLNAVQSVQGKIAGVNIIGDDAPGSTPNVVIRGLGTALGGRIPLYIVDGFPVDNIQNINSSDIVSMDILKDASSASIYGVRAANGVILITTKKGQTGAPKISVESYVGIKSILHRVDMANARQYAIYNNEAKIATYGTDVNLLSENQPFDTDWYDELIRTGISTNNVASISGGSKVVDYYFSYNFYDEDGMLDGQNFQRTTIRNNNVFKFFNDRLKFNQNLNISFSNEHTKPYGAFNEAYRQTPIIPTKYPTNGRYAMPYAYTDSGLGVVDSETGGNPTEQLSDVGNPLYTVDRTNDYNKTLTIQGGIEGSFEVTDYLTLNTRFGATKYISNDRSFVNIKNNWIQSEPFTRTEQSFADQKALNPNSTNWANNSLTLKDVNTYRWAWEGFATFNKNFDLHHVELTAGLSREEQGIGSESELIGYEVPSKPQYWSMNHASGDYSPFVDQFYYTPRALASYFGRLQYNFDNKYYLSATIRRDGSSTFKASQEYWGTFPSVGLGWTISRENFMQNVKFIDYLKLRGTWGKLGNQDVPLNVSQIMTAAGSDSYNYVFGNDQHMVYGAAMGSPALGLTWEVTREWGLGLDFATANDRLTGSLDYYDKRNTNTILDVAPILNSEYRQNYYAHGAEISNRGFEVNLGWTDKLANGLSYEVSANYSYNKNEVLNVVPAHDGSTGGSLNNGIITKRLLEGQPVYAWWMYEADGVWQTQEEIDNAEAKYGTPKPGQLKYKDQNKDGVIDNRDKAFFGSYLPTSSYGIHLGLGYKDIDFSIDGYGVAGNKVYNGLLSARFGGENITADTFDNRWTGPNSTNEHPGAARDYEASSYYLESGAFFRINNITLGYTLNDLVFKGSKLRFYITAQNPFIFTGYKGFSPEISGISPDMTSAGEPNTTAGIELAAYPTTRNFIFGLNLQF